MEHKPTTSHPMHARTDINREPGGVDAAVVAEADQQVGESVQSVAVLGGVLVLLPLCSK